MATWTEEFVKFVNSITAHNALMTGADDETVTVDGVVKPTFSKDISDKIKLSLADIEALVAGRMVFETLAELNAVTSPTIPSGQTTVAAEVLNDETTENNGLYVWDVSASTWVLSPYSQGSSGSSGSDIDSDTLQEIEAIADALKTEGVVGNPLVQEGTTTSTGIATYIYDQPFIRHSTITTVNVVALAATTLVVYVYSKVGDTFTIESQISQAINTGLSELTVSVSVDTGQYIGFSSTEIAFDQFTLDQTPWFSGLNSTEGSFTDSESSTQGKFEISFGYEDFGLISDIQDSIETKAEAESVSSLILSAKNQVALFGQTGSYGEGTGGRVNSSRVYVIETPFEVTGNAKTLRFFGGQVGTLSIGVCIADGDNYTLKHFTDYAVVEGINEYTIDWDVLEGEFVALQTDSVVYLGDESNIGIYPTNRTDSTLTTAGYASSSRVKLGLEIEYLPDYPIKESFISTGIPFENMLIIGAGQSLMEGSYGVITTEPEYDNKAFEAEGVDPWPFPADAVDGKTARALKEEEPLLGVSSYIRQALLQENNISHETVKSTLYTKNTGFAGAPTDNLIKGTTQYQSGVDTALGFSGVDNGTTGTLAVCWMQGESNPNTPSDEYRDILITLISDYNADIKAGTGQLVDIPLITYQTTTNTLPLVAHGQLDASLKSPLIYMAGPLYQYVFRDEVHIDAESTRRFGAKMGEVIKKVCLDGDDWQPLRATDYKVLGNSIILTFSKTGLVFDVDDYDGGMQTNYGFYVTDALDADIVINSVTIQNSNQVKITCASAPSEDWSVGYGVDQTGRVNDLYEGKCGNLRDSAGDAVKFDGYDQHNWCCLFELSL